MRWVCDGYNGPDVFVIVIATAITPKTAPPTYYLSHFDPKLGQKPH